MTDRLDRTIAYAAELGIRVVAGGNHRLADCAGIGISDNTAWVALRLAMPLGNRVVVRESDEVRLPILAR